MFCCLKTTPKDYCLNSSATAGSDNSFNFLTPIKSHKRIIMSETSNNNENKKVVIELDNVRRDFLVGDETVHALKGVSFKIYEGEFVTIMGKSGSGKSTLLNQLGCLDTPSKGEYYLDGVSVRKMSRNDRAILCNRKIGFIFQNYNLVPVLNVFENIVLPVELDGNKVDKKFMNEVVRMLGLEDKLNNMPSNLSGGQQQRVAIARALVSKPAIVLADEPTGNLDSMTSSDVLSLLKVTSTKFHQTLVMITHNNEIAQLADRIIRIEDGKIVQ